MRGILPKAAAISVGCINIVNSGILAGLFCIAFLSATLFPAQSELALGSLLLLTNIPVWLVVGVAWIGNTAGSCLNWILGKFASSFEGRSWFPVSKASLEKAKDFYIKYGRWSLLLSWAPIIGDPITLVAGMLGENFWIFIFIVSASKLIRYIVLAILVLYPLY